MSKGTLYIIATPIGNLADITLRALETLKNVSLILSEDTRETSKLLSKYNINKAQISYRDQNHNQVVSRILEILNSGSDVGLISDSGTPLISDPGFKLVQDAILNDIRIENIPGASAVISSLVVSGLPSDKFTFLGFLPKSSGQIEKILKTYGATDATLIIYESPMRIIKLLAQINEHLGDRKICLVNELTKIYEKEYRGTSEELLRIFEKEKPRGEFVVLIAKENF